jgi:hypothetical protein
VTPASRLPFEVVEQGKYAYLYPRSPFTPEGRAGLPLRCVALRQRQTGARRGQSPRLTGFDAEELQDLRYLAHAANALPKTVDLLRRTIQWADANQQRAGTLCVGEMRALLSELDGAA